LNAFGEQIGQNEMDFDLNIEVVVEGDDQVLNVVPNVEPAIEIDMNAPASMDYESYFETNDSDGHLFEGHGAIEEVQIVLALQAAPVNFSVEEIQPHELLSANLSKGSGSFDVGQSSSENADERELGNM
jgi:hypothetical protein